MLKRSVRERRDLGAAFRHVGVEADFGIGERPAFASGWDVVEITLSIRCSVAIVLATRTERVVLRPFAAGVGGR